MNGYFLNADAPLIQFRDCDIGEALSPTLRSISWEMKRGEVWAITGPNGGGKSVFSAALTSSVPITPAEPTGSVIGVLNSFTGSAVLVSFEQAAAVIQRERANDDSDFVEGGVDEGTPARAFILEALNPTEAGSFPGGTGLESHPAVQACGVVPFLDRGLKLLSTGEIRRTILCRALAAKPALLVLDEPYEGLDAATRETLTSILEGLASKAVAATPTSATPATTDPLFLVIVSDRWERIPQAVNRVLEFENRAIAYSGTRTGYELRLAERRRKEEAERQSGQPELLAELSRAAVDAEYLEQARSPDLAAPSAAGGVVPLVEFHSVTVAWSEHTVLDHLEWTVNPGEHWLIRGPNGSGKTTMLELITGDNPQVFRNDVRLFGKKRGSGETIWELKARMGIVSYRLHLEYRYFDDISLEEVLLSGLYDSIGMYREIGDAELLLTRRWLGLAGFQGREGERFGSLSYGEQRALLVARAAIKNPPLLILDEPCHGLDDAHRRRVLDFLQAIATHGHSTLLHVTHDPSEVLPCTKKVLELSSTDASAWRIHDL